MNGDAGERLSLVITDMATDDAEARERFMRKLYGRHPYTFLNSRQDVLDDYYEAEKADEDMGREDE